jgi:predicted nucleic acid-binding protein
MSNLYIDTNVFINIINDEVSIHSNKSMAIPASKLFFDALSCKHTLIISSWTMVELFKTIPLEKCKIIFELLKKKIRLCKYSDEEKNEASKKSPTNFQDALHIIIAERERADYIITRNIDDFLKIGTKIPLRKPELL